MIDVLCLSPFWGACQPSGGIVHGLMVCLFMYLLLFIPISMIYFELETPYTRPW